MLEDTCRKHTDIASPLTNVKMFKHVLRTISVSGHLGICHSNNKRFL